MSEHFQKELDGLRADLSDLGQQVLRSLRDAVGSLRESDLMLAEAVIGRDARIDRTEVDIEKKCQHILTLEQPVAGDLRYIMSVLKINMDLERMADQAANIATQVTYLLPCSGPCGSPPERLDRQCDKVVEMVRDCLEALSTCSTDTARKVMACDDEVDELHRQMYAWVTEAEAPDVQKTREKICYLKASHELERIADHAVNICEDILFVAEGRIARHGGEPV
jgi:phosphate transport system protein